ncbi:MAG: hypothetical protein IJ501_04250 [Bacilli bacterium]|nr:hypothetical protein [Bacilli bacterium]
MNFDSQNDKKRYIELMKYFSQKIGEGIQFETLPLSEVDKLMYELDPEINYIEMDEYNHLRYLIDTRLCDYEKEIIYMTFGFYNRHYNKYEIARKLKMTPTYITQCRNKILLKLKKWILEEDIVKKSSK